MNVYYFNYQFVNYAGGQVDISFEEFGRPETVRLDADDVLNWLRVFRSREDPFFVLKATNKSNGVPLKINGEDEYHMMSHDNRLDVFVIDISATGEFIKLSVLFWIMLNQLSKHLRWILVRYKSL